MLNELKREILGVLKFLRLVENLERIFIYLSGAKTYNEFDTRVKDLKIYEKSFGLIVERTHCKKPYNKSTKVSAKFEQSTVVCHRGAIAVSYDFSCVYSTRYGSDTNKINYSIFFDQHYLTIAEAIERFEQMLMSIEMEELS
jgi:hypothetical protein